MHNTYWGVAFTLVVSPFLILLDFFYAKKVKKNFALIPILWIL